MGRIGSVRFSACTWLFSSTHNTMARSGGFRYRPTISRTFSTNCGSLENLKFSTRCGCNPNACQIRTIAFCDRPVSAAISRVLQCVLFFGLRLQRLGYDFFNLMIRDLPWRTYPQLIQQALQSEIPKSFPPLPDGRTRNMQLTGDFRVAHFLPTRKHDASTHGHCLS